MAYGIESHMLPPREESTCTVTPAPCHGDRGRTSHVKIYYSRKEKGMPYYPFTKEERERARNTDLAGFLRQQGEEIKRSGSENMWLSLGQKVTLRGNLWFHQYEQVGGDAIDFCRKFYGMDYPEAVMLLLGMGVGCNPVPRQETEEKPFELPLANENMHRVYAYLTWQRGIHKQVLDAFAEQKMVYEDAKYHNAVFVGFDPQGVPVHAHKRGTGARSTFKGNVPGSVPEYSFHWCGTDEQLFLFESPIDLLSFICLYPENWKCHSYAAACSVSDRVLWQCLADQPNIRMVYLCFDSDNAGQRAAKTIARKLEDKHINHKILVPSRKDWNEDLLHLREEKLAKFD